MQSAGNLRGQAGPQSTRVDKIIAALGDAVFAPRLRDAQRTGDLRQGPGVMWSSPGLCLVFLPLLSFHREVEQHSGKFSRTLP